MREYLFRAYDKTTKRYRKFDGQHDTMTINEDGKVEYYNLQNGSGGDEYILEQFTGLHDKNGVEIFEGDIYTAFGSRKYEIRFINGAFCGGLLGGDDSIFAPLGWESPEDDEDVYLSNELFKFMEVIGNIHNQKEK